MNDFLPAQWRDKMGARNGFGEPPNPARGPRALPAPDGSLHLGVPPVIPRRKGDCSLPASPALFWWCGGILLASALTWVLYRFNPSQYGFYPRCVFNLVTGLLCPGCGAQRALHQLVHGHILIACRCNLLLMLALPWLAFLGVRHARATLRGTRPPGWLPNPRWAGLIFAVLLGFTLLRNLPGAPFCYLAPP